MDPVTASNAPPYVTEVAAAKRLGMSYVALVNSRDYEHLIRVASVDAEFHHWLTERERKKAERQQRRR